MDAIYYAIREQKGKLDPDRTMELVKNYKNPNSPRGPISIDPATRDVVHDEYLREIRKVGNRIVNVEAERIGVAVKDPQQIGRAK
jgi:branched-chain amino acid transport system substrate-binding protein